MANKKTKKTTSGEKKVKELKFSKKQIIKSQKYASRRDALNALLKDGEMYTHVQIEEILEKFYKGGHK